jgi:hypothetical protein
MADPRAELVTVRELLDHTSGITDAVVPDLSRDRPSSPRQATTSLRSAHLASTPGTSYSYANPNHQVAARLVEVVSGEPFGGYLRRHILEPNQMSATTSTVTDDQPVPGLGKGHLIAYGHAFAAPAFGNYTVGDGGVVSTAADMARWLTVNASDGRAPDGTRIVARKSMRLLHTPSAPRSGYALGWDTRGPTGGAPTRLEHSGSLFTFTSEEALWPHSGYGVVLLFNAGSPMMLDQTAIVHGVFDIVEGHAPPSSGRHLATRLDCGLAALTLTALLLAVTVLGAGVAFLRLAEAWIGRDVTWWAAAYEWPALVVFVLAAPLAATATLLARSWQWWRTTGARPDPEHPDQRAEQEATTGSAVAIPAG